MNSQRVKDKLRIISQEKNISFNILLRQYMYERFIERLAISKYKLNFILKGGYYLSTLFGIKNRSTMDIDVSLKNSEFTKENLLKMITEIINIDILDGAILLINDISLIREQDEYGGYRITLNVKIDNINESFHFDVVTGDYITPKEIVYKYVPLVGEREIKVLAYNMETVLAEKLETVLSRGVNNSRMKDYYDIYLIMTIKYDEINCNYLRNAIYNTFKIRGFVGDIRIIVDNLRDSKILESKWLSYSRRKRIQAISYLDTIFCIEKLVNIIDNKLVSQ